MASTHFWITESRGKTLLLSLLSSLSLVLNAFPGDLQEALATLKRVGPKGSGNPEAISAIQRVKAQDLSHLTELLQAMDSANELSANWIRSAVESIAQREQAQGKPLPLSDLATYLFDTRHSSVSRQLAFELIESADSTAASGLLPAMVNDPSAELRLQAIQTHYQKASQWLASGQTNAAKLLFQQLLGYARDAEQIEKIAAKLKDLGVSTDLAVVFGWVRTWKVIGPFDNANREGYDRVYPPEKEVNLSATYPGKSGDVRWQDLISKDDFGKIDANIPLGKLKETIAYCYTEVLSEKAQTVELRLGCKNAWKVWLNGQLLFGRDEYHRGAEIDQYRLTGQLKAGKNTILVKLGQNEQKEDWTVEWEFQLRITDNLGTPISPLTIGIPASGSRASQPNPHSKTSSSES